MKSTSKTEAADQNADVILFSEAFVPAEDFEATAAIPVLGKEPVKLKLKFRTLDPDRYFEKVSANVPLIDFLSEHVTGWDDEVAGCRFSQEALAAFCRRQNGAANAILDTYQRAIVTGKVGN